MREPIAHSSPNRRWQTRLPRGQGIQVVPSAMKQLARFLHIGAEERFHKVARLGQSSFLDSFTPAVLLAETQEFPRPLLDEAFQWFASREHPVKMSFEAFWLASVHNIIPMYALPQPFPEERHPTGGFPGDGEPPP